MVKPRRVFHTLDQSAAPGAGAPYMQNTGPVHSQDTVPAYAPEVPYLPDSRYNDPAAQPGAQYGPLAGFSNLHIADPPNSTQSMPLPPLNGPAAISFGSHTQEPIPVVPHERIAAQRALGELPLFKTIEHAQPPLGDTRYEVIDQGISGPDFLRLSMYNVPTSAKLRESTKLPLSVLARPFAHPDVPVADFSSSDPPRCNRCRAYVNPATQFTSGGSRFVCNLCQFVNRTPDFYYEQTDATGRRIDWQQRPELSVGTYDLELPPQYGEGHVLRHIFAIDVSRDAASKGLIALAAAAIRQALYGSNNQPGEGCLLPDTQIAIVAFNKSLFYFRLSETSQLEMVQDGNLQDPMMPPDVFVNPEEAFEGISQLLDKLPELFAEPPNQSCYGSVLQVAKHALAETGGRVSAICTSFPSTYPGKLVRRDSAVYALPSDSAGGAHELPKELFAATALWYTDIAKEYSKMGIGLDFFAFPTGYVDLTNFGYVAQATGGRHQVYPQYVAQRDARSFMADFVEMCAEPLVATQTAFKVRTSTGLQVEKVWAPEFGIMDSQTTVLATLTHDGVLDPKLDAQIQCAVLYTTPWGTRRLRVCNIPAGVTDKYKSVLNFVDSDVVVATMARQAAAQMYAKPLAELRKLIFDKVHDVFASARAHAGTNLPPGHLLVPTQLRALLPMSLALTKCPAFSSRTFMSDSRTQSARQLERMTVPQLSLYLYPRIYPVHELFDVEGIEDLTALDMLEAKLCELSSGGCYLLFNGARFLLFVTAAVPPLLIRDLLGAERLEDVSPYLDELPELDTEISRSARRLCLQLAEHVGRPWCPLQLAREGLDGAEHHVVAQMIEDAVGGPAYLDYIQKVHHQSKVL